MTNILGIDPGNVASGWAVIDATTRRPLRFGKSPNHELIDSSRMAAAQPQTRDVDHVAIEMIQSYGMAVGASVFETCVWVGRYAEALHTLEPALVYRPEVKLHHCRSSRAKDANVRQALVDRFAGNASNYGKGTKADPGWFYGFAADVWQAYALAVYVADVTLALPWDPDQHRATVAAQSEQGALL